MRYFLEVAYKGTHYAGFQVQNNANTIQAEVEKALAVFFQQQIQLTGSSRTDAGVHALQNFFHFDLDVEIEDKCLYNLNAILPADIVVKSIRQVEENHHARFDAVSREYKYYIYSNKNPFLSETAWYYPYAVQIDQLNAAADIIFNTSDFTSFAKRNSQVFTHQCSIQLSKWYYENECLVFNVKANRFLRGMVRGLVGTMILVGRNKMSLATLQEIIDARDNSKCNFATPAHGLFLVEVAYPYSF